MFVQSVCPMTEGERCIKWRNKTMCDDGLYISIVNQTNLKVMQ